MKKLTALFLALLFLTCSACAQSPALPTFTWQRNGNGHWQQDPADIQPHTLDDLFFCAVCGSEVWVYEDGSADIFDYDEHGNQTRYTGFDEQGQVISELVYALTYEQDQLLLADEFIDGVHYSQTTYAMSESGEVYAQRMTTWLDDSTTSVNTFDEHGNCIHSLTLDENNNPSFETYTDYALNDDGWYYTVKDVSRFGDGSGFTTEYNAMGDPIRTVHTEADGSVWSDTTYEYGYDGMDKLWCRQYAFGRLALESEYADGMLVTETEYPEEGGRYIYEYNENGDIILITAYDTTGALVSIESFEYDEEETEEEEWFWFDGEE